MALSVKELMAKVGKIKVLTNRLVDEQLSGEYHSSFKGQGVEFEEVRAYQFGDDVRSIDWNVTAKMSQPYVKRFSEERELTIYFLIDVSGSQIYGSTSHSKAEKAAEIAALLALTAVRNQDKVALVTFSDKIETFVPPRKGIRSVMRIVREVLSSEEKASGATDISTALKFLNGVQKRRAIVFLISDFLNAGEYERILSASAGHHDLVAVRVFDPAEETLPNVGLIELIDPESGECELVDTSNKFVREGFAAQARAEYDSLKRLLRKSGIDTLEFSTADEGVIGEIRKFFKKRAAKK